MSYNCVCDYDPPGYYCTTIRKARKQHRCEECSGIIEPKEKYEYTSGSWDGRPDSFKTCIHCVRIRVWVKNNIPCFCWAHGSMLEDAGECIREARFRAPEEAAGVMFGFLRRKVLLDRHNDARSPHGRKAHSVRPAPHV